MDDPVFTNRFRKEWTRTAVQSRLYRLRKKHPWMSEGENVVPYTMRHTFATDMMAAGVHPNIIGGIMGHTDVSTTAKYQHPSTEHFGDAIKKTRG